MNVIDLLISQHKEVETLFSTYENGDHSVANTIVQKLELHTKIEETLVYPAIREYVDGGDEMIDHAVEEHNTVKELLERFKNEVDNERLLGEIKTDVLHHVQEEETRVFPDLEEACSVGYLDKLGQEAAKVTL